jgi:hypothetical protein
MVRISLDQGYFLLRKRMVFFNFLLGLFRSQNPVNHDRIVSIPIEDNCFGYYYAHLTPFFEVDDQEPETSERVHKHTSKIISRQAKCRLTEISDGIKCFLYIVSAIITAVLPLLQVCEQFLSSGQLGFKIANICITSVGGLFVYILTRIDEHIETNVKACDAILREDDSPPPLAMSPPPI